MTVDERIEQLVAADERQTAALDKLTAIVLDVAESVKRLERVAGVLLINDEELDRRLTELEGRAPRRPQ